MILCWLENSISQTVCYRWSPIEKRNSPFRVMPLWIVNDVDFYGSTWGKLYCLLGCSLIRISHHSLAVKRHSSVIQWASSLISPCRWIFVSHHDLGLVNTFLLWYFIVALFAVGGSISCDAGRGCRGRSPGGTRNLNGPLTLGLASFSNQILCFQRLSVAHAISVSYLYHEQWWSVSALY